MVSSDARTVTQYLASLPEDRRATVSAVRDLVNRALPAGFVEGMQYGMICWFVPLARYPITYNKQPLGIVALASQKQYMSLYLMGVYSGPGQAEAFEEAWAAAGKRLNMGKACLRFKKLDDLAMDVLADVLAATSVEAFIERYEAVRAQTVAGKKAAKKTAKQTAKKTAKKTAKNKTPAKKTAKKTAKNKTPANKTAKNKTPAKKSAANKTAANKAAANKAAANKTPANKTAKNKASAAKRR